MAQVLWIIQIISKGLVRTLRFKAHILRMILLGSLGVAIHVSVVNAAVTDNSLPQESIPLVQGFIDAVKAHDRQAIADYMAYPIKRTNPIPAINTPEELLKRFDQVFDPEILETIAQSQVEADWQAMGWRGIMLGSGTIWMDFDGKITAVNYQTPAETKLKAELIANQKTGLHESVSQFVSPELAWQTAKFTIRVDNMGNSQYRYASWAKGKPLSEKPDLVLNQGKLVFDGSGGNHSFQFTSGPYLYVCDVIVLGTSDSPIGELVVFKHDKVLLREPAIKAE